MNMKKILVAFLVTVINITALSDQKFIASIENDALMKAGDNDYTHGTCFEYIHNRWHFKGGQNMYAPSDLRRPDHIIGDRPYAGLIYGGIGYDFLNDESVSMWTHYAELDFGMVGPAAGCKQTQKFIHKILDCKDPQGWDNQLHNEIIINGQWWSKYNYYVFDWMALVPSASILAGNLQDSIEIGIDLKIGYNLHNSSGNNILLSVSNNHKLSKLSTWVYIGVYERYYLYNHILEGSMFNHKDDDLGVEIEPFTTDGRVGAVLNYDHFFITYYAIFRTYEFKDQKNAPNYGGLAIGWLF